MKFGGEALRSEKKMTGKRCYATYYPNTDGSGKELSARSVWGGRDKVFKIVQRFSIFFACNFDYVIL